MEGGKGEGREEAFRVDTIRLTTKADGASGRQVLS